MCYFILFTLDDDSKKMFDLFRMPWKVKQNNEINSFVLDHWFKNIFTLV